MRAVKVQGPSGRDLKVFEVVVESEGAVLSFIRDPTGTRPREARGRYASMKEAVKRNTRSTTTATEVEIADLDAARALVG